MYITVCSPYNQQFHCPWIAWLSQNHPKKIGLSGISPKITVYKQRKVTQNKNKKIFRQDFDEPDFFWEIWKWSRKFHDRGQTDYRNKACFSSQNKRRMHLGTIKYISPSQFILFIVNMPLKVPIRFIDTKPLNIESQVLWDLSEDDLWLKAFWGRPYLLITITEGDFKMNMKIKCSTPQLTNKLPKDRNISLVHILYSLCFAWIYNLNKSSAAVGLQKFEHQWVWIATRCYSSW